jgi:serine/threonine protein kinase
MKPDDFDPAMTAVLQKAQSECGQGEETPIQPFPFWRNESLMSNALPRGTRLEEFELLDVIGEGGFGIVYGAHDHSTLQRKVAIKEYMPATLSRRQGLDVVPLSSDIEATFRAGLQSFSAEAQLLAQLNHPALVKVHRFFEANGTAYMAMELYQGEPLSKALQALNQAPDEKWLKNLLGPLLEAIETIHKSGHIHRDIAPDNILVLPDQTPVLLDFGAARQVIGDRTRVLNIMLKEGYAPIEQYAETEDNRQSPCTDVYALGALVYFALRGHTPPAATERIQQDRYQPLVEVMKDSSFSLDFLKAIDQALSIKPKDRPQSIKEFGALLKLKTSSSHVGDTRIRTPFDRRWILVGAALLVTAVVAFIAMPLRPNNGSLPPPSPPVSTSIAKPYQPLRLLNEIFAARNADHAIDVKVSRSAVVTGQDEPPFFITIKTSRPGYIYLFEVPTNRNDLFLIFPNKTDERNRIAPETKFMIPRADSNWFITFFGPKGTNQFLVLVSDEPRDFSKTGWRPRPPDGIDREFPHDAAAKIYQVKDSQLTAFLGTPQCELTGTMPCSKSYGAVNFTIEETDK